MKIYIAKHYWKDNKNATWEKHPKIKESIFSYLKENYSKFVKNRPKVVQKDKFYIYICYEDSKDIYKRDITNITFFISKESVSIDLCKSNYYNLELNIPSENKLNFNIDKKLIGVAMITLFLAFSLPEWVHFGNSNSNKTNHKTEIQKSYKEFTEPWNKGVKEIVDNNKTLLKQFTLNDKIVILQLNKWLQIYNRDINITCEEYENYICKDVKKYRSFIQSNQTKKDTNITDSLSSSDLKIKIKDITKKDFFKPDAIKEILEMNSIYIFLNNHKKGKE